MIKRLRESKWMLVMKSEELIRQHDNGDKTMVSARYVENDEVLIRVSHYDPRLHWNNEAEVGNFTQERFKREDVAEFAKRLLAMTAEKPRAKGELGFLVASGRYE